MGLCYGGPYAILGPKRLGFDAGVSCHGSQFVDFLRGARRRDRAGLHHVGRQGFRRAARGARRLPGAAARQSNIEVHVFPGIDARLHAAGTPRGVRAQDARLLDGAGASILDGLRGDSRDVPQAGVQRKHYAETKQA